MSRAFRRRLAEYLGHPPSRFGGAFGRADLPLILLLSALVFVSAFWRLGDASFWDPDEAHYAETSREMLRTGDWWAPFYNGTPFFDKPVLFHQLQAAAMAAFGPTEFAARIVSSLAAVALILVTVWFGSASATASVGLTAGLLLAASPGVFALSRYSILDQLFTAFLIAGAALLAVAALHDRPRLQWPGYVALALAVLTKGPLAVVLVGLTLFLASILSAGARRRLWQLHWIAGVALVLAISLPWFIYMYLRFGDVFVDVYLFDENIRLYATRRFGRQPALSFYLRLLAIGMLPWTGVVIGRLVDTIRGALAHASIDTVEVVLWAWVGAVVGFFTFSQFKLDHYVWPAGPALYLICARAWLDARAKPHAARHRGARIGVMLVGPLLVALSAASAFFLAARLELPRAAAVVPLSLIVAGSVLCTQTVKALRGPRQLPLPWVGLAALGVTYAGLVAFVIPRLEERKVVPDLARWVAAETDTRDAICTYRFSRWKPAFRYYVDRSVTFIEGRQEVEQFYDKARRPLCVMRSHEYDTLAAAGLSLSIVYERHGMWTTSGRGLWRRHTASDRLVVVASARRAHHGQVQKPPRAVSRE